MDERELPAAGETPEERQRWIVGLCMEMAFAQTQVAYEVIAAVRELAEWYGIKAGIEAAYAVLNVLCQHCLFFHQQWKERSQLLQGFPL